MTTAIFINAGLIAICIAIHYEVLSVLARFLFTKQHHHRVSILIAVAGVMIAHVAEIWVFGGAYYVMIGALSLGSLEGVVNGDLLDCVYFSFINYTTLGYGDIIPTGYIRFTTGLEALTGLVLITWSASFLFILMQRHWNKK